MTRNYERTNNGSENVYRNPLVSDSHRNGEYECPDDVKGIIQLIMECGPQTRKEIKDIWKQSNKTLDVRLSLLKNNGVLYTTFNFNDLRSPFYCFTRGFAIWLENLGQSDQGDVIG